MMERISIKAELSEQYMNHCICTSSVQSQQDYQEFSQDKMPPRDWQMLH